MSVTSEYVESKKSEEDQFLHSVGLVDSDGRFTSEAESLLMQILCTENKEKILTVARELRPVEAAK